LERLEPLKRLELAWVIRNGLNGAQRFNDWNVWNAPLNMTQPIVHERKA